MRQILQNIKNGETVIVTAPTPGVDRGCLLIQTYTSLISAGTERMLVEFGKASYLDKARKQPEKVKMVIDKMRTDGLLTTVEAVRSKLSQPIPLGYSNVGVVLATGRNVKGFTPGDRVVSNGSHADVVNVPMNLCAKIPDSVDDESAAFTVLASIGLQGIRLVNPVLGESVVVTGTGLIGLLTIQLLRANGCRVLAIDHDQSKLELARKFGADICNLGDGESPVEAGMAFSNGRGVDAVLITAATNSNEPVRQAAKMSRKRGRIVLIGVAGLELNRADFYEKELTFQVSCSYGPGRYDTDYEEKGHDYPLGFVRWTEQRNFEAVLDIMAAGRLDAKSLISQSFKFEDAPQAYQFLTENRSALGIILRYPSSSEEHVVKQVRLKGNSDYDPGKSVVGFIGAGNYASRVLIPAFKKVGAQLHTIVTSKGIGGVIHGKKAGFAEASTDVNAMLENVDINTVVIVSRHDTHADFTVKALNLGKNIFVEKPLAISEIGLAEVEAAYMSAHNKGRKPHVMVGFNRRFSPLVQKMKALLQVVREPKSFIMTMNAGAIPADHWTQDVEVGGGRIIGEACHYIDLMRYLAGSEIVSVQARRMGDSAGVDITEDKAAIVLGFADDSFGTIHYYANGSAKFPKERIEVFSAGRVLQLDNFRKLTGYGWPGFKKMKLWKQDKGQIQCVKRFLHAIESGAETPIPAGEIFEVARVAIEVAALLRSQGI